MKNRIITGIFFVSLLLMTSSVFGAMVENSRQGLPAISITSQPGSTDETTEPHQGSGLCLRIFTADSLFGFNGGNNLYRYADNNPALFTDPWGLFEIDPELKSYHPSIESELEDLKGAVEILYKGNLKEYFLGLINGKNMKLKLMNEGAEGYFAPPDKIYISKSALSKSMKIERLSVLVHEMTHIFVLRDDSWSLSYWANRIIGCIPYPDFFNRMPGHIVPGFTTVQEFFPTFVEENFVTEGLGTINQW
ncbi:MAG: hypothetical protein PHV05_12450 [Candidatus Riflebacteria bacterium]|nr:hypothetical protein [Candidatus Riflebacteria bacterium]